MEVHQKIKLYPLEKTANPYSCHYSGIIRLVKREGGKKKVIFLKPVDLFFLFAFRFEKHFRALFCSPEDSGMCFACVVVLVGLFFFNFLAV